MVKSGQKVIIAAHGNSLRALVKYLDKIPESEIVELNIPTGIPLVCMTRPPNLKPIKRTTTRGSGSHRGSDEGRGPTRVKRIVDAVGEGTDCDTRRQPRTQRGEGRAQSRRRPVMFWRSERIFAACEGTRR